jgi:hypothetical protein
VTERNVGAKGQLVGPGVIGCTTVVQPIETPTLPELGLSRKQSAKAQKLADMPLEQLECIAKSELLQ